MHLKYVGRSLGTVSAGRSGNADMLGGNADRTHRWQVKGIHPQESAAGPQSAGHVQAQRPGRIPEAGN